MPARFNDFTVLWGHPMPGLPALLAGALLALPALAHAATGQCAMARDPVRCEARQAALKTCADKRKAEKQTCLDAHLPPPDCSRAPDPRRCETAQRAKEICRGTSGKELRQCLRDQQSAGPSSKPKPGTKPKAGA